VPAETEGQTAEAEAATDTTTVAEMRDEQEHICPRCGGTLVTRTVSKGERKGETFVGCSNFPKCRYTK
jgi:ssDNA-binding Zn-finger/Zn-ribbon topoisomerase 1